ncbi:deoxyribose-phosphate aldolase [Microbacterium sp.]|uniref:Cgl0159 family (beta/alpha)8-fold protein n=1 Tax=Microbacterium sp. TaxID=51671 RepID=UPI00281222B2|nr:deoxyribose-phosphate aldolase [Microbacterium sp.]
MNALTEDDFRRLRTVRAESPRTIRDALAGRRRREIIRGDGRLFIIAADHPARGALAVGGSPYAMADRYVLLDRLATALRHPGVDGVLGTPDIIDDLAVLGLLDDKIVVGSMNRGGLRGASFEMDDRYTGYDVPGLGDSGIDFAKALVRINLEDEATAPTLASTAQAVTAAARAELPIMLEPFLSRRVDGRIVNDLSPEAVMLSIAIASGLGTSSARTWLKLPVVDEMERVLAATTLPVLLLGGDAGADPDDTFSSWEDALSLPGVRGLTVGRTLLYSSDIDVASAIDVAASLVHPGSLDGPSSHPEGQS